MYGDWWFLYQMAKARQNKFIRKAEIYRLRRKYLPKSKRPFNGFRFLLNNLGKILIKWGSFLQKRYET